MRITFSLFQSVVPSLGCQNISDMTDIDLDTSPTGSLFPWCIVEITHQYLMHVQTEIISYSFPREEMRRRFTKAVSEIWENILPIFLPYSQDELYF